MFLKKVMFFKSKLNLFTKPEGVIFGFDANFKSFIKTYTI